MEASAHKKLLLGEATLAEHHAAQAESRDGYLATLLLLLGHGIELSSGTRARVLGAAWARRDHDLGDALLEHPDWGLPEVARALQLLDAGRQWRALTKRISRLVAQGGVSARRMGQLHSRRNDLEREGLCGSVSGALARRVQRWVGTLPAAKLESYAMGLPREPWRLLADLCHLSPADFQLPWFLGVMFGQEPPKDSAMAACAAAQPDALPALASQHKVPYSYLRTRLPQGNIPDGIREAVAGYESTDTLLWYYEELRCPVIDQALARRLADPAQGPTLGCGKLMERIFALRDLKAPFWEQLLPVAQRLLSGLRLPVDAPVVVLGDASGSMQMAIRVATIIGGLLSVLCQADLRFFNGGLLRPKRVPRRIEDVVQVVDATAANGSTAPAAALWPSLEARELVRSFIVVTDEEENTSCQSMRFDEMMRRYRQDCYPAQVVFISFIDQRQKGQMASALALREIPYQQFRLDKARPDLTKLDAILGRLGIEGGLFGERVVTVAGWAREAKVAALVPRVQALLSQPAGQEAAPEAAPQGGVWGWLRSLLGH